MPRSCSVSTIEVQNDVYARCLVLSRESDEESIELDIVPRSEISNIDSPSPSKVRKTILEINHDATFDDLADTYVRSKSRCAMLTKPSSAESSSSRETIESQEASLKKTKALQNKGRNSTNVNRILKFKCPENVANETISPKESKVVRPYECTPYPKRFVSTKTLKFNCPENVANETISQDMNKDRRSYKCTPYPKKFVSALGNEVILTSLVDSKQSRDSTIRPPVYVSALGNVTLQKSVIPEEVSNIVSRHDQIEAGDATEAPSNQEVSFDMSPLISVRTSVDLGREMLPKGSSSASSKFKYSKMCNEHTNVRTKLDFGSEKDESMMTPDIHVPCGGIEVSSGGCKAKGLKDASSESKNDPSVNSDANTTFYSIKDDNNPNEQESSRKREFVISVCENPQNTSLKSEDQATTDKSRKRPNKNSPVRKARIEKPHKSSSIKKPRINKASPAVRQNRTLQEDNGQHVIGSEPFPRRTDSLTAEVDSLSVRSSCNSMSQKDLRSGTSTNLIEVVPKPPPVQPKRRNLSDDETDDETRKKVKLTPVHVNCLKPGLVFEIYTFLNQFSNSGKYGKQTTLLKTRLEEAMPCLSLQTRATEELKKTSSQEACYQQPPQLVWNSGDHEDVEVVSDSPDSTENPNMELMQTASAHDKENHEPEDACIEILDYPPPQPQPQPQPRCMLTCHSPPVDRDPCSSRDVVVHPQQMVEHREQVIEEIKTSNNVSRKAPVKKMRQSQNAAGKHKKETAVLKKKAKVQLPRMATKTKPKKKQVEKRPRKQTKNAMPKKQYRYKNLPADREMIFNPQRDFMLRQNMPAQHVAMENMNFFTKHVDMAPRQVVNHQQMEMSRAVDAGYFGSEDMYMVQQHRPDSANETELRTRKGSGDNDNANAAMALRKSTRLRCPRGYEIKVDEFGEQYMERKDSGLHEAVILSVKERRQLEKENMIKKLPRKSASRVQRDHSQGECLSRQSSTDMQRPSKRQLYNSRDWLDSVQVKNMYVD